MSYAGEPINEDIPADAMSQCLDILDDMKSLNMKHNDIKPQEVLVKDGRIHLCDFGWCSIEDDLSLKIEGIRGGTKLTES